MPQYGKSYVQENRRIPLTNGKYMTRERAGAEIAWLCEGYEGPCPIFTEDLDRIAIAKANAGLAKRGKAPVESAALYPSR